MINTNSDEQMSPLRRQILTGGLGLLAASLTRPTWAANSPAVADEFWIQPRTVSFVHAGGERLKATYWSDGELIRPAYDEISWFMRDRVAQRAVYMHPVLLDIAYSLNGWLEHFDLRQPLRLTSAYRTPDRNRNIEGAAKNSMHTKGSAMDIQIPGISTKQVASFGRWLGGGGVGWYPSRGLTHMDRGRLRSWRG